MVITDLTVCTDPVQDLIGANMRLFFGSPQPHTTHNVLVSLALGFYIVSSLCIPLIYHASLWSHFIHRNLCLTVRGLHLVAQIQNR